MARIVVSDPAPSLSEPVPEGLLSVTPHATAAEAIGSPHTSLQRIAKDALQNAGVRIATEIESHVLLKRAIERVEGRTGGPAASSVKPILETVLRTGIDPAELQRFGSPRAARFALIALEYESELHRRGLVDRSAILWRASQLKLEPLALFIYGYFRARKEEIFFINAVAGEESIYHLPCHANPIFKVNAQWAERLKVWGWTLDENDGESPASVGSEAARRFVEPGSRVELHRLEACSYPDIETEVRAVLGKAKALVSNGMDPSDVAIVSRDVKSYAPLVSLIASEYGLPVKIELQAALLETFTGSFISLVLDCVENGCDRDSVIHLLKHPYGTGISGPQWPTVQGSRITGVEQWKAVCNEIECLEWPDSAEIREYANFLIGALERFDVRAKSGRYARETNSYSCFAEALAETAKVERPGKVTLAFFIATVREVLASVSVDFATTGVGIKVCEPNVIIGGRFRHIFSVGMAEGIFPARSEDNAIIDFHERKRLMKEGIEFEEAAEVPRWEALSFYFMLRSARESLCLSYPQLIGKEVKIESPFFAQLGVEPVRSRATVVASPSEFLRSNLRNAVVTGPDFAAARRRYEIELERESIDACGEYDGMLGEAIDVSARTFSVSQLTSLGQCGFKWFGKNLLRLLPSDEPETQLSPITRGSFYHRVLEIAFKKAAAGGDIRARLAEVLDDAFVEAENDAEKFDLPQLVNWDLQRTEHLEILRRAIAAAEFIQEDAKPLVFEAEFRAEWEGFQLCGKIDRVDRTVDGLAAIDYKTGSAVSSGVQNEEGKANVDLQLPIYISVALPKLFPNETVSEGVYYSLTKGKRIKAKSEAEDLAAFAARARAMLSTGDLSVGPDVELKACTYCDLDIVCRNGHRIVRKRPSK